MRVLTETVPLPESWRALGLHVGTTQDPKTHEHLGQVLDVFLRGFRETLEGKGFDDGLARMPVRERGWAWEGVGMAMALYTLMSEGELAPLLARFESIAPDYQGLIGAGIGYAHARIRRPLAAPPEGSDPLWGWAVFDGYGFYLALRRPGRYVERGHPPPEETTGDARAIYYQGLGRSLWFTQGARPDGIARAIAGLPEEQTPNLWGGVGTASAYTGGASREVVAAVADAAGEHRLDMGVGIAIATHSRGLDDSLAPWTETACDVVWGRSGAQVASLATGDLQGIEGESRYLQWRARIRARLADG